MNKIDELAERILFYMAPQTMAALRKSIQFISGINLTPYTDDELLTALKRACEKKLKDREVWAKLENGAIHST